ncbi:hypothetical protein KY362_06730 [Candidatus Woesearchaeota archaeon]|nr:hypothetical protein [Candidatus Woesearchaeota archaeon]
MAYRLDPVTLSKVLKHYKRREVQEGIVEAARSKEAVGSYGGKGYAKRPDVLMYPNDVIEQVMNGVTSFHVSEEIWSNPQRISIELKNNEYNALRVGWDLVLDIDCPWWEFSKITTWLFVRSLQEHGVSAVTVKFSGNKGFHIGVPFEAFPTQFKGEDTKDLFPDAARKIAGYLLDHIGSRYVEVERETVRFGGRFSFTLAEIERQTGKKAHELIQRRCERCGKESKGEQEQKKIQFTCPQCNTRVDGDGGEEYVTCPKCKVHGRNVIMERFEMDVSKKCCKDPKISTVFNPLSIVEVDTVLIAQRHLYRAPYSYHEKSGKVSVPIAVDAVLDFEKEMADPDAIEVGKHMFLDRSGVERGQAQHLMLEAYDSAARASQKVQEMDDLERSERLENREFEELQFAIPEKFFPPCIQEIAKGVKDGRKRVSFLMTNFLTSCGWDHEQIEEWLRVWNEKNPEPLRDQYFLGQVRYAKQHKKKVLPPNCDNDAYYKSFGVCKPDNFCRYIKNPANYAIKRARYAQRMEGKKGGRGKDDGRGKAGPGQMGSGADIRAGEPKSVNPQSGLQNHHRTIGKHR